MTRIGQRFDVVLSKSIGRILFGNYHRLASKTAELLFTGNLVALHNEDGSIMDLKLTDEGDKLRSFFGDLVRRNGNSGLTLEQHHEVKRDYIVLSVFGGYEF